MKKIWKSAFSLLALSLMAGQAVAADGTSTISRGEYLSKVADCAACHTAPGGKPFAGGLKMPTPVGAIYSTNITPDSKTGIGGYTYNDFANALRNGIARDGHHLYPAMPYTSFAKVNDDDMHALYDFFMHQVTAVKQENRASDIPWPLNMRWPLAMWNEMFLDGKRYQPDSNQSAEWNRGAYLVQGLAHCGACHTPRGIGFQEKAQDQSDNAYLTGGTLDGWHAPNLTSNGADGLRHWKETDIQAFLKTGHNAHSTAFGSMTDVVVRSMQHLSDADLKAIAVYLKSLAPSDASPAPTSSDTTTAALIKGDVSQRGAQEYVDSCSACHRLDGKGYSNTYPALAQNAVVMSDDPSSLINIVLHGGRTPVTKEAVTGMVMPDFGWRLNDSQVADVVTFIRNGWGNKASAVTAAQVSEIRKAGGAKPSAAPLARQENPAPPAN